MIRLFNDAFILIKFNNKISNLSFINHHRNKQINMYQSAILFSKWKKSDTFRGERNKKKVN